MTSPNLRVAVAVALTGIVVGCGSTVPLGAGSSQLTGQGLSGTLSGGNAPGLAQGGSIGQAGPVGVGGLGSGPARNATGATTAAAGPVPSTGSVATTLVASRHAPIKVAALVSNDYDTVMRGFGFQVSAGDLEAQARAVFQDINAHGGLAGHPVNPVYENVNTAEAAVNPDGESQAVCTALTQDNPVAAVINSGPMTDLLAQCLASHGVLLIGGGPTVMDDTDIASFRGFFYHPYGLSVTRLAVPYVDQLKAAGYFGSRPRVGIIRDATTTAARSVSQALRPALARAGIRVVDEAAAAQPDDMQGIVLRFNAEHIDHVVFLDTGAGQFLFFAEAAEQQVYRPRYALTSFDDAATVQSLIPASQLHQSMVLGWVPIYDVDADHQPTPTATEAHCVAIMRQAGQDMSSTLTAAAALGYCDPGMFLKHVADRAGGLQSNAFRAAVGALGRDYVSALAMGTRFIPGRYDGAAVVRVAAYQDLCTCYSYTTGPTPIS